MTDETPPTYDELAAKVRKYERTLYGPVEGGGECGAFFLQHAEGARDGGSYLVCARCGHGMDAVDEDESLHEDDCPNRGKDPMGEMIEMLSERLGPERTAELFAKATEPEEDE